VSVIDTANDQVVATIKTGGKPHGIAATPDGRRLYVSDQPSGSLRAVDLATREVSERIPWKVARRRGNLARRCAAGTYRWSRLCAGCPQC